MDSRGKAVLIGKISNISSKYMYLDRSQVSCINCYSTSWWFEPWNMALQKSFIDNDSNFNVLKV